MSDQPEPTGPHDRFGVHVKGLREVRKLTQDQLAARSGLAADTIRRLEYDEFSPSLRTLKGISRGLGISFTALFGSWEMNTFEVPRRFAELFAIRPLSEQHEFAEFWAKLIPELDRTEPKAEPSPEQAQDAGCAQPTPELDRTEPEAEPSPEDEQSAVTPKERAFGRYVRLLRIGRGMTQEVLAEYCGLSSDTIRRLEKGSFSPSLDTLRKLCKGLDLSLGTLFICFELGEPDHEREIIDLLRRRSAAQRALGLRMLRASFDLIDKLTS